MENKKETSSAKKQSKTGSDSGKQIIGKYEVTKTKDGDSIRLLPESEIEKSTEIVKVENKPSVIHKSLGLSFKGGSTVIKYCENPDALRKVLSEGLYGAICLFSADTNVDTVKAMIADVIEDYKHDDVSVIIDTIADIRKGKRKIYGKVTPFDLREMITEKLEKIAIDRESKHSDNKGFGEVEAGERKSGRLSDHFKKNTKFNPNLKKSK